MPHKSHADAVDGNIDRDGNDGDENDIFAMTDQLQCTALMDPQGWLRFSCCVSCVSEWQSANGLQKAAARVGKPVCGVIQVNVEHLQLQRRSLPVIVYFES